ncbi:MULTISPECIES: LCP family protein [Paenibacillus]|uniref:LCP family protein n=1 Tax=Paenibacillus TaxID=44249 RepID=UPI0022B9206C|nr:LCP family protein [Paenibacillus caseinilyticus]MCZ8523075.1 LCP family protein [Paenibacillus caseinilyticus]
MARTLKWTFGLLITILLVGIGYFTYSFLRFANNIQDDPASPKWGGLTPKQVGTAESYTPPKWEGKQRVNVLILGGDSRGLKKNEIPRSDSIMVASIDPVTKKAYLFSILRDTYVKIPGHGEDRINTAIATGGPNLAMKTVSDLLGIPVQYYVYTDFKGFIALIDAIGGIEIDVEKDMKYKDSADGHEYDIDLKKGLQQLDGKKALQYVRFRHDALSDFSRTERQRKFIQAVAVKMQSTGSLIRLPKVLSSIDPYISTNLTTTDMLKLGTLAFEAKTEGMVSSQIPPTELVIEKRVGGAEVLSVNKDKLQSYIKALFEGRDPFAPAEKAGTKSGSGASGSGTSAAKKQ